jgi:exopolysaccharide biosynthesis protein
MRIINIFFISLLIPLSSLLGGIYYTFQGCANMMQIPLKEIVSSTEQLQHEILNIEKETGFIKLNAVELERLQHENELVLKELTQKTWSQKNMSDEIYEKLIMDRLGMPIGEYSSGRVQIEVFELKGLGYRGYIAKLKLFDPAVFQIALGKDTLGESEITSAAVKRTGAILGINGGGFYSIMQDRRQYILPIGNTVINGKLIGGFKPSHNDLFFAGVDSTGELLGDVFYEKNELLKLKPVAGVSFVPALIKNRKPLPIPVKWRNQKQPRTIIGEYGNDDLILAVVDGRQADWSSGVTLEDLQIKLTEFGVIEAYNLDGGGSSSFVFEGNVLNRPSDGKERPVATNIVILP